MDKDIWHKRGEKGMSETEKRAPVQRMGGIELPWDMHLAAYEAYAKKWGEQPAMIDLEGRNCRGGFSVDELDVFIPGWQEVLAERDGVNLVRTEKHGMNYVMHDVSKG